MTLQKLDREARPVRATGIPIVKLAREQTRAALAAAPKPQRWNIDSKAARA